MVDMKYEEVYNASIPAGSWDRTRVSDKTNIIYCRYDEKSTANTHRCVSIYAWRCAATERILFCFSRCGFRQCCPKQREKSHSDRVTQILYRSRAFASLHTRVLLCTPLWRTDSLTCAVILFALWLNGPLRAAAVVVVVVCPKHQSRSVNAQR